MPIRYEGDAAILQGQCVVEEAEVLLDFLRATPQARIDATALDHAHTAVVQLMMAFGPEVKHRFTDPVMIACLGMASAGQQAHEEAP